MDKLTSMAAALGEFLKSRGESVAVAESSAGGLVSAALLAVPGASAYYAGGGVIYTRESRRALLGLPDDVVTMRAANEEYALVLARAVREKLNATWGLCETGAAGPTGNSYGDAAGHVCIAVAGPAERAVTLETGDVVREANMWRFASASLELLETVIMESAKNRP
ncbi:MAG: CinA family protein [Rhodospirillales bacterium]|nr:CinA family protein [Rhodospirillales bacterium]